MKRPFLLCARIATIVAALTIAHSVPLEAQEARIFPDRRSKTVDINNRQETVNSDDPGRFVVVPFRTLIPKRSPTMVRSIVWIYDRFESNEYHCAVVIDRRPPNNAPPKTVELNCYKNEPAKPDDLSSHLPAEFPSGHMQIYPNLSSSFFSRMNSRPTV